MNKEIITFFDTTLRDGEQTPNVSLTDEQKLTIAKALDKLGVDVIEAGFPISSKGEYNAVKSIVETGLRATVCGLSLIHISEPTRLLSISYAVFCLKKKKHNPHKTSFTNRPQKHKQQTKNTK